MRSAARKTYEEVQAEFEDNPENHAHLYAAYHALSEARERRGTLDLDLPERKVTLGPDGKVQNVAPAPTPGRAQADRGIHDPGECLRCGRVGAAETALHVPRARPADAGEAG